MCTLAINGPLERNCWD